MDPEYPINVAVEGDSDAAVIRRLLNHTGLPLGPVFVKRGKCEIVEIIDHAQEDD